MEGRRFNAADLVNDSVVQLAVQAALSVLISGGSASDREAVAIGLHTQGHHSRHPFQSLVCDSASLTLPTEPGTIYLTQVDRLTPDNQAVLFTDLTQQKQSHIIAGTSADLWGLVQAGRFSATLFYRLNMLHLIIPSTPGADAIPRDQPQAKHSQVA